MHMQRLAPLLSATVNIVRSWIILGYLSVCPRTFHDAHEHPRLAARHRPARLDRHGIAFLALVTLVMGEQFRGAADVLPVHGMLDQTLDGDGDGLVHLVADDLAGEQALSGDRSHARRGSRARFKHGSFCFGRHQTLPPRGLTCASTVFTRAMFLRTFAN